MAELSETKGQATLLTDLSTKIGSRQNDISVAHVYAWWSWKQFQARQKHSRTFCPSRWVEPVEVAVLRCVTVGPHSTQGDYR